MGALAGVLDDEAEADVSGSIHPEIEKKLDAFELAVANARDAWHAMRRRDLIDLPDYTKVTEARAALVDAIRASGGGA